MSGKLMTINRSGWMLCSLVLLGCGAIGDVSEKVGGMINPHLEVLGGGAPVVSEDGGDPVFTYLQHVGDEPYQECREWREDWTRARLEGDSEALAELKDEVEGDRPD